MGSPAARLGDPTVHGGAIVVGLPTVLIGGQPAARIGDMHVCPMVTVVVPHVGGPLVMGSFTVLTGGVPQSRVGDMLVCVGPPDAVAAGCQTVMVGMAGGGLGFGAMLAGLAAAAMSLPILPTEAHVGEKRLNTADGSASSPTANKAGAASATTDPHAQKASELCGGKGLADPDLIGDFVSEFKAKIAKNWDTLSADERFGAVKAVQEEQFKKIGIPAPTIARSTDEAAGYDNPVTLFGRADAGAYSVIFNGNLFNQPSLSSNDQKELAKTMMHEGRHIEQYNKIAQYRAANGDSAEDIRTKDTPTHGPVSLPTDVVENAAQHPLPAKKGQSDCPNFAKAKEWNDAKYGKGQLSQYRPEVSYMERPLERDAFGLEPTIDAKW